MHVCSALTNPFIVAVTALRESEQVSKICKPDLKKKKLFFI